jgi:hypothetical protein
VSSVHRILVRNGMNRLPANQKHRPHRQRCSGMRSRSPGRALQLDVKFLERIPRTRKRLYQFTAIDDCTRIRVLKIFETVVLFLSDARYVLPWADCSRLTAGHSQRTDGESTQIYVTSFHQPTCMDLAPLLRLTKHKRIPALRRATATVAY